MGADDDVRALPGWCLRDEVALDLAGSFCTILTVAPVSVSNFFAMSPSGFARVSSAQTVIVVPAPPPADAVSAPDELPTADGAAVPAEVATELPELAEPAAPVSEPAADVPATAELAALDVTGAAEAAAPDDVGVFALLPPQATSTSASVAVTAAAAKERGFIVLPGAMTTAAPPMAAIRNVDVQDSGENIARNFRS